MALEALQADLAELEALHQQATRPRVQKCLATELQVVKAAIVAAAEREKQERAQAENRARAAALDAAAPAAVLAQEITNYAWDQTATSVKLYISALPGAQGLAAEHCTLQAQERSLNLFVTTPAGKRFRLAVGPLHDRVVPGECTVRAKPDGSLVVTLRKASAGQWDAVKATAEKHRTPKLDKDEDPSKGIMKMMQNLYEEGDDEMKRTIAKAFAESRSGKKPDFNDSLGDL